MLYFGSCIIVRVVRNKISQVSMEQNLELVKRTECLFLFDYSVATDFHCFGLKISSPQISMERNILGAQPGWLYLPSQTEANREQGRALILQEVLEFNV